MKTANDNKRPFCHLHVETLLHIFVECVCTQEMRNNVETHLLILMGSSYFMCTGKAVWNSQWRSSHHAYYSYYKKTQILSTAFKNMPNMLDFKQYLSNIIDIEYLEAKPKAK